MIQVLIMVFVLQKIKQVKSRVDLKGKEFDKKWNSFLSGIRTLNFFDCNSTLIQTSFKLANFVQPGLQLEKM